MLFFETPWCGVQKLILMVSEKFPEHRKDCWFIRKKRNSRWCIKYYAESFNYEKGNNLCKKKYAMFNFQSMIMDEDTEMYEQEYC